MTISLEVPLKTIFKVHMYREFLFQHVLNFFKEEKTEIRDAWFCRAKTRP